jgi:hypothetical protein
VPKQRSSLKPTPDRRPFIFAGLVGICLLAVIGYTLRAMTLKPAPPPAADAPADTAVLADVINRPHLVFLHSPGGDTYRQVAVLPLDAIDGQRYLTPLMCQRVSMNASQGLCMGAAQSANTFDTRFRMGASFQQPGVPTRSRVAPTGDLGTMTWFVAGHSYADASFSTHTVLVDPRAGSTVADLEQFTILKDDLPFRAVDFNFWGVTFTRDARRFFSTLASGGKTYLIEGDVAARQARVLRENVECPSLSPDNTRLVFKKRVDPESPSAWRLAVLDLSSMAESMVPAETHSVDDQAEWLDDNHILYALQDEGPPATIAQNVWVASLDGSDAPHILLRGALSPIVVR